MNKPAQQIVVHVASKSNGFGLAGLILSCIGWFTGGLLCIVGALLSFIGLFFKPRGIAIAGLLVGFPGVMFFGFVGLSMLLGLVGLGSAVYQNHNDVKVEPKHEHVIVETHDENLIIEHVEHLDKNSLVQSTPDPIEQSDKVDNPYSVIRTFTDATNTFSVEATVISAGAGQVSLKRVDNEKIVTIPISKLSEKDQRWINANFE